MEAALEVVVARLEACALTRSGDVWCWRHAANPEPLRLDGGAVRLTPGETRMLVRADGSMTTRFGAPMPGIADVVGAASGSTFECALHRDGRVSCWSHALATETPTIRRVPELDDARTIAAGGERLCAVTTAGAVRCWSIERGEGIDFRLDEVPDLASPAAQVVVGDSHACALRTGEDVVCWGNVPWPPVAGVTKDGEAHRIEGLPAVAALYGGPWQVCARGRDDTMWCWGRDREGQLGDGVASASAGRPGSLRLPNVRQLVAKTESSCALLNDGEIRCWGTEQAWTRPHAVGRIEGARELAAQDDAMCVRTEAGEVRCRETRFSAMTARRQPDKRWRAPLPPVRGASSVTVGSRRACAVGPDGRGRCWSKYEDRDLDFDGFAIPGAVEVVASLSEALYVRTNEGRLHCLGRPSDCIDGAGLTDVAAIAVGGCHVCALDRSGALRCGGCNKAGQIGSGERTNVRHPLQPVPGRYFAVSTDFDLTCAITRPEREVVCWGDWSAENPAELRTVPHVRRPALALAAGTSHACALVEGDEVVCWGGKNTHGELGNGWAAVRPRPTLLPSPSAEPAVTKPTLGEQRSAPGQ
ncbi:hypothetical protein OV079_29160 [Nannocystis pusilla]|uniref:Uncharacterized protein n=1 Tax=Nannocystis pusilla TaxID=889268 RepID=A0A9X3EST0_9BACT|nr:hypothetical protein [Nannocystis pusilla]